MLAGVLAAGHGRRLGARHSKALTIVAGKPMLFWCLQALDCTDPQRVYVITNSDAATEVRDLVAQREHVEVCVAETASALESFVMLLELIGHEAFLVAGVDSMLTAAHADRLAQLVLSERPLLALSLTTPNDRDDGTALHARLESGRITAIGDPTGADLVTAGGYAGRNARELPRPPGRAQRWGLRHYLGWLATEADDLRGVLVDDAFDIDTAADLARAHVRLRSRPHAGL